MKNKLVFLFLIAFAINGKPQSTNTFNKDSILNEGMLLYRVELSSWLSTDYLIGYHKDIIENSGGYVSYIEGEDTYSTYFDENDLKKVVARIKFPGLPVEGNDVLDTVNKLATETELTLYQMRESVALDIENDENEFYSFYKNTQINLVPIITNGIKKVYILTAPKSGDVVLFGNDYLIELDEECKVIKRTKLHKSLIDVKVPNEDQKPSMIVHSHVENTPITATDICTCMLYKNFLKTATHYVIGPDDVSIFDGDKQALIIMKKEVFFKINKIDQK